MCQFPISLRGKEDKLEQSVLDYKPIEHLPKVVFAGVADLHSCTYSWAVVGCSDPADPAYILAYVKKKKVNKYIHKLYWSLHEYFQRSAH